METELERMLVRLVGDGSSYQQMMQTAAKQTEQTASLIKTAGEQIESIKGKIEGFASTALSFLGGYGLATSLEGAFHSFEQFEAGVIRMSATLKGNNRDVDSTVASYKQFATEMEKVSTLSKGQTMNLLRAAETFGLTGQQAKNAAAAAVQLAYATTGNADSAEHYLRITQALEQGDIKRAQQMSRMIPQLRGIKDETEYLTKVNKLLNVGQEVAIEMSNTAGNQMERLGRAFKGVTTEIGKMISDTITPFLKIATGLVEQFNALDPSIKRVVAGVVLLTLALFALPPILALIWKMVGLATGGVSILTGILAVGFVSVVSTLAIIIERFGGVGKVMEWLKGKALEAWEWIKPVRQAIVSLWQSIVEKATETWQWVESVAKAAWVGIMAVFQSQGIDFGALRDNIRDAFIFAEFTIRNFGQVWAWVWAGAKLYFIVFVDIILDFFTQKMPAILNWFGSNWKDVLDDAFIFAYTVAKNMVTNWITMFTNFFNWIVDTVPKVFSVFSKVFDNLAGNLMKLFRNLPALVKGTITLDQLGLVDLAKGINEQFEKLDIGKGVKKLDEGFIRKAQELHIPERVIGPLEKQLREEYERLGVEVAGDFAAFRDKKLAEWAKEHVDDVKKQGEHTGEVFGKGVQHGLHKLELALFGSAEALSRMIAFQQSLNIKPGVVIGPGASSSSSSSAQPVPVRVDNNPAAPGGRGANPMEKVEMLLRQADEYLAQLVKASGQKPIEIKPANFV